MSRTGAGFPKTIVSPPPKSTLVAGPVYAELKARSQSFSYHLLIWVPERAKIISLRVAPINKGSLSNCRIIFVDVEVNVLKLNALNKVSDGHECDDLEIQAHQGRIKEIHVKNIVGSKCYEEYAHRHAEKKHGFKVGRCLLCPVIQCLVRVQLRSINKPEPIGHHENIGGSQYHGSL